MPSHTTSTTTTTHEALDVISAASSKLHQLGQGLRFNAKHEAGILSPQIVSSSEDWEFIARSSSRLQEIGQGINYTHQPKTSSQTTNEMPTCSQNALLTTERNP